MTPTGTIASERASRAGRLGERRRNFAKSPMISVSSVDGVGAIERFSIEIDRLNAVSARPNPFLSSAFLRSYALRSEYHRPGTEERLYLIREGDKLIGCAPMRRSLDVLGPGLGSLRPRGIRLRVLAPYDNDQPGILSAPHDEQRAATALIGHLCTREKGWGMLEFAGQRPGGTLHEAALAAGRNFRTRVLKADPAMEVAIIWNDLISYFRSLAQKMRSNISRQARRLFANGEPELVLAEGAPAVTAWFDTYCDLDDRSWKRNSESSIRRNPRRVRYYREMVAGRSGLDPSFIGVLLDGVLMAGMIAGSNATASPQSHGTWCFEMAYDRSRSDLGPGQLLFLLAIGQAIERGARSVNFMQNFAYYKHRWKAAPIDVVDVQLIRRMSLHDLRTSLSDMKGRWRGQKQPAGGENAVERSASKEEYDGDISQQDRERARRLAEAALAYKGPGIRRLDRAKSRLYLPFDVE
jgi:Acetyltransferase (GNAT) domain